MSSPDEVEVGGVAGTSWRIEVYHSCFPAFRKPLEHPNWESVHLDPKKHTHTTKTVHLKRYFESVTWDYHLPMKHPLTWRWNLNTSHSPEKPEEMSCFYEQYLFWMTNIAKPQRPPWNIETTCFVHNLYIPVLQGKTQIHELNKAVKTTNSNLLFPTRYVIRQQKIVTSKTLWRFKRECVNKNASWICHWPPPVLGKELQTHTGGVFLTKAGSIWSGTTGKMTIDYGWFVKKGIVSLYKFQKYFETTKLAIVCHRIVFSEVICCSIYDSMLIFSINDENWWLEHLGNKFHQAPLSAGWATRIETQKLNWAHLKKWTQHTCASTT